MNIFWPNCLLCVLGTISGASAQFAGGSGDGHVSDITVFGFVEIPFVASANFMGGPGDGHVSDTTVFGFVEIPFMASANFMGGPGDGYASDTTRWPCSKPTLIVDARVFLEGPYSGGSHVPAPAFLSSVPNRQPYGDAEFIGTDLQYDGPESFFALPDSAVDWLRLSLRSAPDANSTTATPAVGFVMLDGTIRDYNGTSPVSFYCTDPGLYYLVVGHRNHASIMSSDPLDLSDKQESWDFTNSAGAAYTTGPVPMKDLSDSKFGMFVCDISHDGQITASDFNVWLVETKAVLTGYRSSDCSFDAGVTASDFNLWLVNTKAVAASQVPR